MKTIRIKLAYLLIAAVAAIVSTSVQAQYAGAPRTFLFNPSLDVCIRDASKFKKAPPYVVGFSNAGLGDSWRVVDLHSLENAAHDHASVIKKLLITDAGHDDAKQIADIQDLVSRGVDLLIASLTFLFGANFYPDFAARIQTGHQSPRRS
jgi:ribose transport system substrate-binding protein